MFQNDIKARDVCKIINDRERLKHALELTLSKLGVQDTQVKQIVSDVRNCDFTSLKKTMKI